MQRKPYEQLALLPWVVADCTARHRPYTAIEWSDGNRNPNTIEKIERLRLAMTPAMVQQFVAICDLGCRYAYDQKAEWFMKVIRSRSNAGRDKLYMVISHWLCAYLDDPEHFMRPILAACHKTTADLVAA